MKLVLIRDVPTLGKKHDIVDVRRGYGRNFLLPNGLATLATAGSVAQLELIKQKREDRRTKMQAQAKELAQKIKAIPLTFEERVTNKGILYGSVGAHEIADALSKAIDFRIDSDDIALASPLRTLGEHRASIRLNEDTQAVVHITIKKRA